MKKPRKPISDAQREAVRLANLGKRRSEEKKQRMSEARIGIPADAEAVAKAAAIALKVSQATISIGIKTGRPGYVCLDPI